MTKSVLVVDDAEDCLNVTATCLRLFADWTVYTATSGKAALEDARSLKPDVILLDYHMPEMSGCDVLEALKSEEALAGIPVFFYTADPEGLEKNEISKKADGILAKPLNPESLAEALDR